MTEATMNLTTKSPLRQLGQLRSLLFLCLLWLLPTLACGSFAPRPTPTPSPLPATPSAGLQSTPNSVEGVATPLPAIPTDTPVPQASPTLTTTIATTAAAPTGGN